MDVFATELVNYGLVPAKKLNFELRRCQLKLSLVFFWRLKYQMFSNMKLLLFSINFRVNSKNINFNQKKRWLDRVLQQIDHLYKSYYEKIKRVYFVQNFEETKFLTLIFQNFRKKLVIWLVNNWVYENCKK
jgi:hypothetical protein